jgi:hypothetical protein
MRTTLDLPDELFRQVKARAAMNGETLKELLMRYVESGLKQPDPAPGLAGKRSRLPVIKRRSKSVIRNVTSGLRAELEQKEDLARLRRSFGR